MRNSSSSTPNKHNEASPYSIDIHRICNPSCVCAAEWHALALDYFSGGKYREALNILSRLDKKYKLNPRFKAYIGLCYYYEWNYSMACTYIDPYIEDLEVYAPHERSIYYFTAAESHFFLGEYDKAVPLYEKMLTVCYNKEKGDAFFRIAFCNMEDRKWGSALENLKPADVQNILKTILASGTVKTVIMRPGATAEAE